jgi:hypothetical protein
MFRVLNISSYKQFTKGDPSMKERNSVNRSWRLRWFVLAMIILSFFVATTLLYVTKSYAAQKVTITVSLSLTPAKSYQLSVNGVKDPCVTNWQGTRAALTEDTITATAYTSSNCQAGTKYQLLSPQVIPDNLGYFVCNLEFQPKPSTYWFCG